MSKRRCRVTIELRPDILDPAGQAIQRALHRHGFSGVTQARVGKVIDLEIDVNGGTDLTARVTEMCAQILANPITENYRVEWLA